MRPLSQSQPERAISSQSESGHTVIVGGLDGGNKGQDARRVEQAVKLSAEKYCSASIMLGKVAEITHDFEIVEA